MPRTTLALIVDEGLAWHLIDHIHMKTRNIFFIFVSLLCGLSTQAQASDVMAGLTKETYTFAIKGQDTLLLDVITDPSIHTTAKRPVMIYMFGGAWEAGNREAGYSELADILPYFARKGYVAVAFSYRLQFLRERKRGLFEDKSICDYVRNGQLEAPHIWESLNHSIRVAIEDLFDATSFIVKNADKWNADTSRVIVSGSSAGAISPLTAENLLCNGDVLAREHLPEGFRYACIMPFAGGVWKNGTGTLEWKTRPCPVMMFHGTDDGLVPYETETLPQVKASRYGPRDIARQLRDMQVPYALYTVEDGDHSVCLSPIIFHKDEMLDFIKRVLIDKEQVGIEVTERDYDAKRNGDFLIKWVKEHPKTY